MAWYQQSVKKNRIKRDYVSLLKYKKLITMRVDSFKGMCDIDVEEGTQIRFLTEKPINAITILSVILEKYVVEEICIAVFRMNQPAVSMLEEIIANEKIALNVLVSSFFAENKKYEKWAGHLATLALDYEKTTVGFSWNHAKVMTVRTTCGKHFVFEGSGNHSDNARIEQYLFENNLQMYNFHNKWIKEYIRDGNSKYKVTE